MNELIWLGVATITIAGICFLIKKSFKKRKKKEEPIVQIDNDGVTIMWAGHKVLFEIEHTGCMLFYKGSKCDEVYSVSLSSSYREDLPWKLWAKCGDDEITIVTDLESKYEVI